VCAFAGYASKHADRVQEELFNETVLKKEFYMDVILNETKWSEESLFIFNILREILRFAQNDSLVTFSIY